MSDSKQPDVSHMTPPWEQNPEAFEAMRTVITHQHIEGWRHDWGRSVDTIMQQLQLSRPEALLYLAIQQLAGLRNEYRQMISFQQKLAPRTERLLKLMEKEADEMEKGDDWKKKEGE